VTADHVLLALVLAGNLYLSVRTHRRVRRLSAQMAVLTLRLTDLVEMVDQQRSPR